ncbi:alanyl-tRNA editing protein [Halalkalibacter alkalisediminis]|uniref:Alanine--tRNA ligase-related protein n=1 Tax=Halalkalibacter alkalisediminis TaxID=935616 RepID=A0ABV6NJM1_9BACI|nr:alanine--tRNA ligase-related protein [Halalkalibacter alkalisediminis]
MKEQLFYLDPYIKEFTATIEKHEQTTDGKWYIVLDQTAFYPTGGGQPHDEGFIENEFVVDVQQVDGEIRHYLNHNLQLKEKQVKASINWERRFDHMQQHAGQHILSAAFTELFGFETVSFHLGKSILTIDLAVAEISSQQVSAAEERANQMILHNHKIDTKWLSLDEAESYPLRKQPSVLDQVRLVIIPNIDYNPCGGTHPKTTGEVRAIKILGWEQQKGNVRMQFICGNRVITQLAQKHEVMTKLTELVNAPEQEVCKAVRRLLESEKNLEKKLEQTEEKLLTYEAREWLENGSAIRKIFINRPLKELQKLAKLLVSFSSEVNVFLVAQNNNQIQIVGAKGKESTVEVKKIFTEMLPLINGKGGGSEFFVQGGGEAILSGEEFLEKIKNFNS